jgi:hypothetical protein
VKTGTLEKVQVYGLEYLRNGQQLRNIGEDMETYEVQELDRFTIYIRINYIDCTQFVVLIPYMDFLI